MRVTLDPRLSQWSEITLAANCSRARLAIVGIICKRQIAAVFLDASALSLGRERLQAQGP